MAHSAGSHEQDMLHGLHAEKQLRILRSAVEDAAYELYQGKLSFQESEALARAITAVRGQIADLERDRRAHVGTQASASLRGRAPSRADPPQA